MFVRLLPLAVAAALPTLFMGCGEPEVRSTSGVRPERLAHVRNSFAGDWGPGAGYVANDWIVRFASDGRVSVMGPGMTARGTYVASGSRAEATYEARDGKAPTAEKLRHGDFALSKDGTELTFTTGIPDDPPVHLVRKSP